MSQSKLAAIGLFVGGGALLFAIGLFMIGDRRLLFVDQFELKAQFTKVTGLEVGTTVRVAGLDAGEVTLIELPSRPSESFVVTMRVREDLHQLVRTDSVCTIQTDGIVGSAFIQIGRGTDEAPIVPSGGTIQGNDPIEFVDLIEEGRETFRTVTAEFLEVREDLSTTLEALADTARTANGVVADVGNDVEAITSAATDLTVELKVVAENASEITTAIREGRGTVGRLMTDEALYEQMRELAGDAQQTVANMREATGQVRQLVTNFTAEGGPGEILIADVRTSLAETQEILSDLAESTEALKRNFLFRGYFADRGFFDLDSLTAEEYRAGALERNERTPIRIWLASDQLFVASDEGRVTLTEDGRRRVDSVMADFLRYPRDSLLVVEGYAEGAELRDRLLLSQDRSIAVRAYLVDRFRRDITLTGTMPLGSNAVGSPSGDGRWSGVALALFVRNEHLTLANGQ